MFIFLFSFLVIGCRYKEPKASFSIVEVDTIAIDNNVLNQKTIEERD